MSQLSIIFSSGAQPGQNNKSASSSATILPLIEKHVPHDETGEWLLENSEKPRFCKRYSCVAELKRFETAWFAPPPNSEFRTKVVCPPYFEYVYICWNASLIWRYFFQLCRTGDFNFFLLFQRALVMSKLVLEYKILTTSHPEMSNGQFHCFHYGTPQKTTKTQTLKRLVTIN